MGNQRVAINQSQKPIEGYRGVLIYRQEYGYKLITVIVDFHTPDERSRITGWAYDLDIPEEAEHLPAGSPLAAIDPYHFLATDGMEIGLTIRSQEGEYTAYYLVAATSVEEHSSFLWLDVMKDRGSLMECKTLLPDRVYDVRS